jgi:nucleotide-binding universal stress UspA family protein
MAHQMYLAYDGSINADWVARYAIRMCAGTAHRQLTVLHILDGSLTSGRVAGKIEGLSSACTRHGVELKTVFLRFDSSVLNTLLGAIPAGKESYCICGARATSRDKGFLAGTISQKLLRARKFNTLAIRVVNPGLLGCPATMLLPLSGHPRKFKAAMPFFTMLLPCIKKLVLVRVMTVHPFLYRYLSAAQARNKIHQGTTYLAEVTSEIEAIPRNQPLLLDHQVLVSDDWPKEIVVHASKVHAGLIMLGASDRLLQSRFYYGSKIEEILRRTPCDVGIYRTL